VDTVLYVFWQRNSVFEVLFDQHTSNRCSPSTAVTCIFDKYRDGNFRVFLMCKSKEYCVVFAMRVLNSTCLATHIYSRNVGSTSSSGQYRTVHALNDRFVVLGIHTCPYFLGILFFENSLFTYSLDEMRTVLKTSVCHDGHQTSHLHWGDSKFTLPAWQGNVETRPPAFVSISLGVIFCLRDEASFFTR